jgi:hypothetical protein
MVIRWRTDNTEASVVSYGLERNQLTSSAKAEGITAEHVVQLTGLQPNTRYYYAVGSAPLAPPNAAKKEAEDAPGRACDQQLHHATARWPGEAHACLGAR